MTKAKEPIIEVFEPTHGYLWEVYETLDLEAIEANHKGLFGRRDALRRLRNNILDFLYTYGGLK